MATATIPVKSQAVVPNRSAVKAAAQPHLIKAPALFAVVCFAAGILCAHFFWFLPGWMLISLLAASAVAACALVSRLAWLSVALVYVSLGALCFEIAPAVNPQRQLALLADNIPHMVEGDIVRLGPVRTVVSTTPFSTKTHEEHSRQIDVRVRSIADSTVRVTIYAPVEEVFPRVACGDSVRATLAMHP